MHPVWCIVYSYIKFNLKIPIQKSHLMKKLKWETFFRNFVSLLSSQSRVSTKKVYLILWWTSVSWLSPLYCVEERGDIIHFDLNFVTILKVLMVLFRIMGKTYNSSENLFFRFIWSSLDKNLGRMTGAVQSCGETESVIHFLNS